MKYIAVLLTVIILCAPVYAAKDKKAVKYDEDRQVLLSPGGPSGGYGDFRVKAWMCSPANAVGTVFEGGGGASLPDELIPKCRVFHREEVI